MCCLYVGASAIGITIDKVLKLSCWQCHIRPINIDIHFIRFLVESQSMQILLLIKFQSASLCNFKTFSTNYILITIKIFLDLSFSASKMSGIVSGLIFKVKHNFPVANKYRSELVILNHSCQSSWLQTMISILSLFLIIILVFTNSENLFLLPDDDGYQHII